MRDRLLIAALILGLVALTLATVAGCGTPGMTPPYGAHGEVISLTHRPAHTSAADVPRKMRVCRTVSGTRRCTDTYPGDTTRVTTTIPECWQVLLQTSHTYCVSRALWTHTKIGDTW